MLTLSKSSEDYLEAVLALCRMGQHIRSVDLARYMGYSRASICHAVKKLRDGGFLTVSENGCLCLTNTGRAAAEKITERRQYFEDLLTAAGVSRETARRDACQMGHAVSEISFRMLKEKTQ